MERVRKFLHLKSGDRSLLVGTTLLLGTIRLGLQLLPFRTVRRVVSRLARPANSPHGTGRSSVDRVVWMVSVASQYVPRATCLTQALAAQVLLGRHGHPTRLRVGVAKSEAGRLEAHAWLENQGRVIVGGGDLSRYTSLPGME